MSTDATNTYGHRRKIHLYHQPRKSKGRGLVHYYSLATCYFEDGKNKKKILQGIGELTEGEADQYRFLLKAMNGQIPAGGLVDLEQVVFGDEKQYLDVLVGDAIWRKLGLDKVFDSKLTNNQKISTESVARILTINRILQPRPKSRTIEWFGTTLLAKVMGIDAGGYDRNKVFRELSEIHKAKPRLERLFWSHSKKMNEKCGAYYFDGTTSWFEGSKCPLADADLEKTRGFFPSVVGLMLITDNEGFPLAWEAVHGHDRDTTEVKEFVRRISKDYGIKEITYCFDRGVASDENFELISESNNKYISAIKDNQIKKVFDLDHFQKVRVKITDRICEHEELGADQKRERRRTVTIDGFCSSDENIFFKDLGIKSGKRYVASFNYELFCKQYNERQERIERALLEISDKNTELIAAKRDRDYNATERDLLDLLAKHHVKDFFTYSLLPATAGSHIQSFKIECQINQEKLKNARLADGLLLFVTDHIEMKDEHAFVMPASDIIAHYKGKYVVENAFRELKTFIDLRPFFVWTEEHVKAHYDICIVACFINNYINSKIAPLGRSLREFHANLEKAGRVAQLIGPTGKEIFKLKTIAKETRADLESLGIKSCLAPELHKSHGVLQ